MSGRELIKAYKSGERNFAKANLREANLRGANLREANLREAILSGADLSKADLRGADLSWAILSGANLREANLRGANLREADLSKADLRGADLDFTEFQLSCKSFDIKCDLRLVSQLLYHLCRLDVSDCPEWDILRNDERIISLANKSHVIPNHKLPEIVKQGDTK